MGVGIGGHAPPPHFWVHLSLSTFIRQSDSTSDIMQFYADLISTSYMWVWLRWPLHLTFASYTHGVCGSTESDKWHFHIMLSSSNSNKH